jgi:CheY-like chemotaxis protein
MPHPRALILDDDPARHSVFARLLPNAVRFHAYTAPQAIEALECQPAFDIVFLEHDLPRSQSPEGTDNPGTGFDVVAYIATSMPEKKTPGRVWIHTWNTEGRRAMSRVLRNSGIPFTVQRFRAT